MGSPVFHTDTSIALRGVSRPFDPIQAFSRIARLRQLQQRGQINELQLEDLRRERGTQQAVPEAALGSGGNQERFVQLLRLSAPEEAFRLQGEFAEQARGAERDEAGTQKIVLENASKQLGIVAQLSGPLKALEEGGADLETMQVAYADVLERAARLGIDTSKLQKEYIPGFGARAFLESVEAGKQIDQALRKMELEKKIPGRDVPFPPGVFKQKQALARARLTEKPPNPRDKVVAQRTKDRAMARAVENYSKKIDALENTWVSEVAPAKEGGERTWFNIKTGARISNEEYLAKRREVEDELISAQEQADLSFLAQIEAAGFEPGLPVDFRAQARARRGQPVTTPEEATAAQTLKEGDILVNHETGERIVLRGGKWVPVPR